MSKLQFRTLHVSPADSTVWKMLAYLHEEGWAVRWHDYANHQFHFLLVKDE